MAIGLYCSRPAKWVGGASGRNGGQLGSGQCKDQIELEKLLGNSTAHALWDLAQDAKALSRSLIADYDIDCDLKPGVAHPNHKPGYAVHTRAYVDHLREHYQYDSVEYLERAEMATLVGSDSYHGGRIDYGAGHLHPLNYALGMADAAIKNGAILHENTVVESYQEDKPRAYRPTGARSKPSQSCLPVTVILGSWNSVYPGGSCRSTISSSPPNR